MPDNSNGTRQLNRQIDQWLSKVEKAAIDFSEKDRKKLTRKAARPFIKAARTETPSREDSNRNSVNYRYEKGGGSRVAGYNPGNLRRSIRAIALRRAKDTYVGPQFARRKVKQYGGPGQPVDGYYAAMVFGSARAFRNRVLLPAAKKSRSAVIAELKKASRQKMKARARARKIKTT